MAKQRLKTKKSKKNDNIKWVIRITLITFVMTGVLTFLSNIVMENVSIFIAVLVLAFIIFVGIIFDIVGTAVTASNETPFHAMSARKIKGADKAIWLVRNAEKVSNLCNDVIGDISGIVSGASSAVIVTYIITQMGLELYSIIASLVITGVVAALTIAGKAVGKSVAMTNSSKIVYMAGRLIAVFKK